MAPPRPPLTASWLALLALCAACLAVYWPVLGNGFVWDDGRLLLNNARVHGLDLGRLRWMATALELSTYQPLGWLAYALIHALAGLNPFAFHAAGIALHILCACLLLRAARRLFALAGHPRPLAPAFIAALLWSVHPLQVQTVAWASEIPDQMSTALFLGAILVYLRGPSRQDLAAALALFALSGLCRWKGVALPLVLLVLDIYPLRRLRPTRADPLDRRNDRVWGEKLAFAAVAAAIVSANSLAKLLSSFEPSLSPAPAARGLLACLWALACPRELLALYAVQDSWDTLGLAAAPAMALVSLLTAWLVIARRRWPAALAAWLCFAAGVLPPLLNAKFGLSLVFPHYAYLASLGLFVTAAAAIDALGRRAGSGAAAAAALALAGSWGSVSHRLCPAWNDDISLWTRAVLLDGRCVLGYGNLGAALAGRGRHNEAYFWFDSALRASALAPYRWNEKRQRANLELLARQAPGLKPDIVAFWVHTADDLTRIGRPEDAARLCARALQRSPRWPEAHEAMSRSLSAAGRPESARRHLAAAARWRARAN